MSTETNDVIDRLKDDLETEVCDNAEKLRRKRGNKKKVGIDVECCHTEDDVRRVTGVFGTKINGKMFMLNLEIEDQYGDKDGLDPIDLAVEDLNEVNKTLKELLKK